MIVTTPGHPFYLEHNIDNTDRPAPQGHEELAEPWVGAGDLKVGDSRLKILSVFCREVLADFQP
jgi:hypothetical protein